MYSLKTIIGESLPFMIMSAAISIGAGYVLNLNSEMLFALPGIIVVIPSFINMNGSILSILSCRLSSALHMGLIKPKLKRTKTLDKNLMMTFLESVVSFLALGLIAGTFNMIFGIPSISLAVFPAVIAIAGMISISLQSVLSILFSYVSYSKGIDPDNWVIPALTSISDFIGVFLLFVVLGLFI
jgi:mgtE-like transporter